MGRVTASIVVVALAVGAMAVRAQQEPAPGADPLHRPLDQLLDVNVRDGLVYYRALQSSRGAVDRYVASLNVPAATYEKWTSEAKMAFWVNAYNAFVLQTVVGRYPIRGTSSAYPTGSIRQIPGAFDQTKHRAAGRSVTLDEIEKTILPEFKEPRLMLALGRGAVGSGRLRSEAYTAARLARQLDDIQSEFVNEEQMLKVDRTSGQVAVTPIISWNEAVFSQAYGEKAGEKFVSRSPIERAIVAFIKPHLLPLEQDFVDENRFKVTFRTFDWNLNDLTGGGRRQ
jgi:Protein of unknown function, DUF547